MMKPIILNLLAEDKQAAQAHAQDPAKIATLIAVAILGVTAGVGALANWRADLKKRAVDELQKKYDAVAAQAAEGTGDLRTWRGLANDLVIINNSRAVLAPQLAWVKDIIPGTIQLSQLSLSVNTEAGAVAAPPVDPSGRSARLTRMVSTERTLLRMEGKAECARPEMEVDEFTKAMAAHPAAKDLIERVQLRSISRTATAEGAVPAAQFVIECQYKGQQM